jgi:hypothetical protein
MLLKSIVQIAKGNYLIYLEDDYLIYLEDSFGSPKQVRMRCSDG